MRSIRQRYHALTTDGDTSSVSSAHAFTLLISVLTSRPALLEFSAQMHSVGVPCERVNRNVTAYIWSPQLGPRCRDIGDGYLHNGVERRCDD